MSEVLAFVGKDYAVAKEYAAKNGFAALNIGNIFSQDFMDVFGDNGFVLEETTRYLLNDHCNGVLVDDDWTNMNYTGRRILAEALMNDNRIERVVEIADEVGREDDEVGREDDEVGREDDEDDCQPDAPEVKTVGKAPVDFDIDRAVELRKQGMIIADIAKELGCSKTTTYYKLKKYEEEHGLIVWNS